MKTRQRLSALLTGMTGRLMLSLILMAVLPASVIGFLAYQNARQTIEERVHAELNTVADLKQEEISRWLDLLISDAQLVADNFLTEEHITVILDPSADPELQSAFGNFLTENLLSLQQSREGYEEIYFVDRGGRIILSTDRSHVGKSVALEPIVGSIFLGDGEYFIEDIFLRDGRPEMGVGYVLHHVDIDNMQVEDLVNAAVVIRVDVTANLFSFLQNWTGRGASGELLLTKRVEDLYVYLSPLRFAEDAPLSLALPDHMQSDATTHADMGGTGLVEQVPDYRGEDVLRTYREIPEMGWGFITKKDQAEAFAPVIQLTLLWSGLTIVIFLVAIGVAVVLARNLTDPLRALGEAALKVGGGDFETRVEMQRSDEFGQLATAFNKMVAEIRDYAQSNRARTEELQALVNHSETLLSSLDKLETLNSALDEVLVATKAEAGAIVLLTDDGDQILVEAARGLSPAVVGMRLPYDQFTAAGTAMINRRPIATLDVEEEQRFRAAPFALDRAVKSNLVVPMLLENRVFGALVLDTFSRYEFTSHETNVAQAIANQTAVALERIKLIRDLSDSYDRTLAALAAALDARDKETEGHSRRVVTYTLALATRMNVPAEILQDVGRGALLHDIGKIGVPDSILHKPGPLADEEWAIIKKHPEWGKQILEGIPFLGIPADMVLSHHDRWDGTGYPQGKEREEIPIGARIFAVADAFDAITSDRPYRKAGTYLEAREELISGKGTQFDPGVVDCFLDFSERDWAQLRQEAQAPKAGDTGALVQGISELRRTITGQLGSLNVIIAAITSSLDLGEVLTSTLESIVHVTWASSAGIFFYESDLDHLIYAADSGFPGPLKKAMGQLAVEDFPHKRVVREAIAEFGGDVRGVPLFGTTRIPELPPEWLSYACVPLTEGQQVVGVMVLFSDDPYVFDDEDLKLFERVGGQLGRAISNARVHERVRTQAITDGLTGAYNRHYLNDFLDIEVKRCQRYKRPMSIMLLDMDHFKQCNEKSGHQAGDQALRDVVHLLNLGVRSVDMVARYGGEEFLVVMPETGEKGASEAAERVRSLIEQHQFPCGQLTASIGIVSCGYDNGDEADLEELVNRADRALFRAKEAGRNQVQVWKNGQEQH